MWQDIHDPFLCWRRMPGRNNCCKMRWCIPVKENSTPPTRDSHLHVVCTHQTPGAQKNWPESKWRHSLRHNRGKWCACETEIELTNGGKRSMFDAVCSNPSVCLDCCDAALVSVSFDFFYVSLSMSLLKLCQMEKWCSEVHLWPW